jgi:AsmA-like C-terminal region
MAGSPSSIAEKQLHRPSWKHRRYIIELLLFGVFVLALAGIAVLLTYWPFRYREVHPLLERTFRSTVRVKRYHRTYFPHPGYVAEGVIFYRHGDTHIPPLASVDRMTVVGSWTNLIFHPHELYEIRLSGLHVQIPPAGTAARGKAFDQGIVARSRQTIQIETIVADGTTLDFLADAGKPPLRLQFPVLQIHNVQQDRPLGFYAHVLIPKPQGMVLANGSVGPFRSTDFGATPLSGTYSLENADLAPLHGVSGHGQASGRYNGTFSRIETTGHAAIPDFRAASAHRVRLDAAYRVIVNGANGDVEIQDTQVRTGGNLITASGSVVGKPNKVNLILRTKDSRVEDLLKIVEHDEPSVAGKVTFHAAVQLNSGSDAFLRRLGLKGGISLAHVSFTKPHAQQQMNAFAARMQKHPPKDSSGHPAPVTADASSLTTFHQGMAYFPNIHVTFPGTDAYLHGTFNLLDTDIHITGKVDLQRNISHAATGWRSALLKPVAPFFRHRDAGAIVSIAVTGTAGQPKITQDVLQHK